MSKTTKKTLIDFEKTIMAKVKSNEISMKPRWYFVSGSLLMILGLVGLSTGAIFSTNLMLFSLRKHGPMGQWRLQTMLDSFPLWVPILAVVGIVLGIAMLRKYDFSYKKNFWFIILWFILSVVLAAFILDSLGLNDAWSRQGPMMCFYQHIEGQNSEFRVPKYMQNGRGDGPNYRSR